MSNGWHDKNPSISAEAEAKQPISARRERVEPWRKGLFFFDAFDTLERCFRTFKTARSRYLEALSSWF